MTGPGYPYGDQPPPSHDPRQRWPGPPPDPGLWVRGTAPQLSASVDPPEPEPETPRKRSPWRWRLTWLAVTVIALGVIIPVSLRASSGMTGTPAAPAGTAAVPCSQIAGQVRAILPYYFTFPGPASDAPLYGLEQKLAGKLGNVYDLDTPLGRAENHYSSAAAAGGISKKQIGDTGIQNALGDIAAACHIIT